MPARLARPCSRTAPWRSADRARDLPPPGLFGWHQIANAGTAVACATLLSDHFRLSDDAIAEGLRRVRWPARLQRLVRGPLVEMLPADIELWLDGGHNPSAGAALAHSAEAWRDRPLRLVLGMLDTKDPVAYLQPLQPHLAGLRTVTVPGEAHALPAERLAALASAAGIEAVASSDVRAAVASLAEAGGPARILIAGSLYLAGTVLAENG